MPVEIDRVIYEPLLILPNGELLPLGPATMAMQWEEQPGELAQRFTLSLYDAPTGRGKLHQDVALASYLVLRADWGEGPQVLFMGRVEEWEYETTGVETVTITAYDDLFALAHSEDEYLIDEGTPGLAVLQRFFGDWGLTPGEMLGPNVAMPKLKFDSGDISSHVMTVLTEAFYGRGGSEYFVRARYSDGRNVIDVIPPGRNEVVYYVTPDVAAAYNDKQSAKDVVTQVHILGNLSKGQKDVGIPAESGDTENAETRPRIDTVLTTPELMASFGRRRRMVRGQESDKIEDLEKEARRILAAGGEPQRTRTVRLPDLPFLRKGDKLALHIGTASGEYIVTSVQHDADARVMTIQYDSSGTFEHRSAKGDEDDTEKAETDVGIPSESQ